MIKSNASGRFAKSPCERISPCTNRISAAANRGKFNSEPRRCELSISDDIRIREFALQHRGQVGPDKARSAVTRMHGSMNMDCDLVKPCWSGETERRFPAEIARGHY